MKHTILAMLCAAPAIFAQSELRLKNADAPPRLTDSQPRRRTLGRVHRVLEFAAPVSEALASELSSRGIQVLRYLPDNAVVAVSADADGQDEPDLVRAWQIEPERKLSADLGVDREARAFLVEFHPDVDDADARAIVAETGLTILENPDLLPGHLLIEGKAAEAAAMAEWDEVAYVFPASADLIDRTPVRSCAGPLTGPGMIGQYVAQIGDGWDGPGKHAVKLGYSFSKLTPRLPAESVKSTIVRALGQWASAAQISFEPNTNAVARQSVDIRFVAGEHGDGYPFDGPGRVLAHTFYPAPSSPEPLAGDMHFDDEENWGTGTDLYSVALHELGHALGLGHSDKPGAVMYPYYRTLDKLTPEDIQALQNMYPAPVQPPSNPPTGGTSKDTAGPALTIAYPALTSLYTSSPSIIVRGTASDASGVALVTWSTASGAAGNATGTTSWTTPAIPLVFGTTTITIRARDSAGNISWRSLMVTRR